MAKTEADIWKHSCKLHNVDSIQFQAHQSWLWYEAIKHITTTLTAWNEYLENKTTFQKCTSNKILTNAVFHHNMKFWNCCQCHQKAHQSRLWYEKYHTAQPLWRLLSNICTNCIQLTIGPNYICFHKFIKTNVFQKHVFFSTLKAHQSWLWYENENISPPLWCALKVVKLSSRLQKKKDTNLITKIKRRYYHTVRSVCHHIELIKAGCDMKFFNISQPLWWVRVIHLFISSVVPQLLCSLNFDAVISSV